MIWRFGRCARVPKPHRMWFHEPADAIGTARGRTLSADRNAPIIPAPAASKLVTLKDMLVRYRSWGV